MGDFNESVSFRQNRKDIHTNSYTTWQNTQCLLIYKSDMVQKLRAHWLSNLSKNISSFETHLIEKEAFLNKASQGMKTTINILK